MSLTPEDAAELVSLCDQVSRDLRAYDDGVPYDQLQIGTRIATIVEPLLVNDDLVPELRKVVPATALHKLKRAIGTLRGAHSYTRGEAHRQYGEAVSIVKNGLQRLVQTQAATAEVAAVTVAIEDAATEPNRLKPGRESSRTLSASNDDPPSSARIARVLHILKDGSDQERLDALRQLNGLHPNDRGALANILRRHLNGDFSAGTEDNFARLSVRRSGWRRSGPGCSAR